MGYQNNATGVSLVKKQFWLPDVQKVVNGPFPDSFFRFLCPAAKCSTCKNAKDFILNLCPLVLKHIGESKACADIQCYQITITVKQHT